MKLLHGRKLHLDGENTKTLPLPPNDFSELKSYYKEVSLYAFSSPKLFSENLLLIAVSNNILD